jgi:energy-coupling factor transporter ATP-binding protein EcfA2
MNVSACYTTRELQVNDFLDRSSIIYGASGSGKSTAIRHLMYLLRGYCGAIIVFSASDKDNGMYSKKLVPPQLVYDHITPDVLVAISERQTRSRKIYDQARTLSVLESLFDRFATETDHDLMNKLSRIYDDVNQIDDTERANLIEIYTEKRRDIMINVIRSIRERADNLSTEEQFTMRWINFNPRIMIIFDDCTSDFKAIRGDQSILEQIFRGRHFLCTSIIALHGPAAAMPMMRLNAYNSIFTDPGSARSFASTVTNGLSALKKQEFERYASRVLTDRAPYTKMLFHSDSCSLCSFDNHDDFAAISSVVTQFCSKCARDDSRETHEWMQRLI